MSFEKINNPADDAVEMMIIWKKIQDLGRNDFEQSAGPNIINLVQAGEISASEGKRRMQSLLDSKQEH
jgi:hypothetical protein